MRTGKRGVFQEQFNWIFVLVAGATIIFFFFNFLMKQQALAMEKTALTINTELESIATGVQSAQDTAIRIRVPKTTLLLGCTRLCECTFGIRGSTVTKPFKDKYIFGPQIVPGPDLVVWSKPWSIPYTVANFVYITSPSIRYVFGYDPANQDSVKMMQKLEQLWPNLILYKAVEIQNAGGSNYRLYPEGSSTEYENEHYDETRVVLLMPNAPTDVVILFDESFENEEISILTVFGSSFDEGLVRFQWLDPQEHMQIQDMQYVGTAGLLGAVFTENPNMYYCNIIKGITRVNQSLEVLANRSQRLSHYWEGLGTGAARCESLHRLMYQTIKGVNFQGTPVGTGVIQSLPPQLPAGAIITPQYYEDFNTAHATWVPKLGEFSQLNFELNLNSCIEVY